MSKNKNKSISDPNDNIRPEEVSVWRSIFGSSETVNTKKAEEEYKRQTGLDPKEKIHNDLNPTVE